MEKLLKVINVSKKYENQSGNALSNISFEVDKGKLLAIVGESGSGKTTLLKLLAGVEETDSGQILLEEKPVTGPSFNLVPGHKQVKLLFQDFRLFPNITLYQNIEYVLRAYSKSFQKERISEMLQLCKLTHLQDRYPRELSGGEQQRAALARALADEPLLLLLDEPFSNMDVRLKGQLKEDLIDIISKSHTTAIVVTHEASDALSMADTIAVIKSGQILQADTPQGIYKQPLSPYTAQFFGTCTIVKAQDLIPYMKEQLQTKKSMPYPKDTLICIRAEHIHLGTSECFHMKATISKISYYGAYYQVVASVDKRLQLTFHTTNAFLSKGERVPLCIDTEAIHYFYA
ncbi:ABC transporter ATP-binding protein [Rhodocytophaga rosea]|uniref:ABC transporter ATP-binding protein n=1 Tax=Rhodocytophaga rosea TaxID=2704465 RepID=A0A6C0GWK0_9BACT|nr:ABC transporter ATP-binding protein [Rhodocytophaga rosea]QHT71680.1 ABC transporter ATP-binding protein [Rhodocytophaga rosea]